MPRYYVYIPKPVHKSIQKIPLPWRNRIVKALVLLETEPLLGEKMRGDYHGYYRVKVWPYRIIYRPDHGRLIVVVVEIDQRGNISYD